VIADEPIEDKDAEDIRPYLPVTELHFQGSGGGFDCFMIPCPRGLRPDSYDPTRGFLQELVSWYTARLGCHHECFLQIGRSTDDAAARAFSMNARNWIPQTGLGVWPQRPAPRIWKLEDLEELDHTSGMPPLLNSLFRVTAGGSARLDAMTTMTGMGCGLQLVSRMEGQILLRDLKELFLNFIQDRIFRIFPWYVPLMEKSILVEPIAPLAQSAMRGISLYIRESAEDGGIIIVSADPLADVLPRLGCKQIEFGTIPKWKLGDLIR
jgi:hypothetical protein